jgi:hypothetical protein
MDLKQIFVVLHSAHFNKKMEMGNATHYDLQLLYEIFFYELRI